jgi:hypothetical protein
VATRFYDALLPPLGFTQRYHSEQWKVWATTDPPPATAYFAVTVSAAHASKENRIAFSVASKDKVDRIAAVAHEAGARQLSGPVALGKVRSSRPSLAVNDHARNSTPASPQSKRTPTHDSAPAPPTRRYPSAGTRSTVARAAVFSPIRLETAR